MLDYTVLYHVPPRGVMFANSFVSSLVGGLVFYWVCLLVGGYVITISFNSRGGVSVGLFYYRFKAIPWILNYKWADYWPYWEFIYLFFSMWPSVICITMGCFMFGVVWVLGFFFISRRALAREGDYEMRSVCACVCALVSRADFSKTATATDFL